MLIYYSGVDIFFFTDGQQLFLGSSTHNAQVQRQLRPLSRATKTSVFFHGADTTVVLRARNTGMHRYSSGKKINDGPESTNGTVWKHVWSTNPLRSITSRVRAMGIQFPINDGMTIPLYSPLWENIPCLDHRTYNNKQRQKW